MHTELLRGGRLVLGVTQIDRTCSMEAEAHGEFIEGRRPLLRFSAGEGTRPVRELYLSVGGNRAWLLSWDGPSQEVPEPTAFDWEASAERIVAQRKASFSEGG